MLTQAPRNAITDGPHLVIDQTGSGPYITWGYALHRLTWFERFQIYWGRATVYSIARQKWPRLAALQTALLVQQERRKGGATGDTT